MSEKDREGAERERVSTYKRTSEREGAETDRERERERENVRERTRERHGRYV